MKILKVNKHTIDVFFNQGWKEHARFKINNSHQGLNVFQIQGTPVNKHTKQNIINEISK